MLAQIKPRSSTSSKLSLLERRKSKLSTSTLRVKITETRNPLQMLKEGIYDIKSAGLQQTDSPVEVADLERAIAAFLR